MPMSSEVTTVKPQTVEQVRSAIQAGEATAAGLTEGFFAHIDARDPAIHAYLAVSKDRAFAQASRIDRLAAAGEPLPVLAGVPFGIKDALCQQGSPATAGSKILEGYMPPYDATVVQRLDAAGAVLLGKLNCDEFAMGSSNENSAYGPVRNPRALDRVPGG